MRRALLAVTGERAGVRYWLEPGALIVGRSSDSGIQVLDDAVSRHHARFAMADDGEVTVEDLGSQNGAWLNGAPLGPPRVLRPGDTICIGATTFVFEPRLQYLRGPEADVIWSEGATGTSHAARDVVGDEQSAEAGELATEVLGLLSQGRGGRARLVQEALRVIGERLSAERGFVLRVDGDDQGKVLASFGAGPITVSRTVVQAVLDGPSALLSQDVSADAALEAAVSLRLSGVRALVAAPLIASGRRLGLVVLDHSDVAAFSSSTLARLVPLAHLLALCVLAESALDRRARAEGAGAQIAEPELVAVSDSTLRLVESVERVAARATNVLLRGDTGVGKEVFARLLHSKSARRTGPFLPVNCGALPEELEASLLFGHAKGAFTGADRDHAGFFEAADGGTLFLDEVAEMSRATQVKLLRVLQERVVTRLGESRARPVDVRVVAATHQRLEDAILAGRFREDLYYRIAVVSLEVPRLAARPADILPLARYFAHSVAEEVGRRAPDFTRDLEDALLRYSWPGNVRELKNVVERLVIMADEDTVDLGALPTEFWSGRAAARHAIAKADSLAVAVGGLERELLLRAMVRTGGVKSAAAEALGISRVTLDAKIKAHGITWSRTRG